MQQWLEASSTGNYFGYCSEEQSSLILTSCSVPSVPQGAQFYSIHIASNQLSVMRYTMHQTIQVPWHIHCIKPSAQHTCCIKPIKCHNIHTAPNQQSAMTYTLYQINQVLHHSLYHADCFANSFIPRHQNFGTHFPLRYSVIISLNQEETNICWTVLHYQNKVNHGAVLCFSQSFFFYFSLSCLPSSECCAFHNHCSLKKKKKNNNKTVLLFYL